MDAALVVEALHRALGLRRLEPETLLHHTDQGSQYRATDYRDLLRKREILQHVRQGLMVGQRRGGELFLHPQVRADLDDDGKVLISPQQLQRDLAFWVEGYYNRERRHSTIGYISLINYEQRCIVAPTLTPMNT